MALRMRRYAVEEDYWSIRNFLRQVYAMNNRHELAWPVFRLDYCRHHAWENIHPTRLEDAFFLWEAPTGDLAAVLNPEDPGDVHLQIAPPYNTGRLVDEMLATAEELLGVAEGDGTRRIQTWAHAQDATRQAVLRDRGYSRGPSVEHQRYRSIHLPLPEVPLASGYEIRSLGGLEELPSRSWASWRAFHPQEPAEKYRGWEWYLNVQKCALYRRDLDLVAIAPDGSVAAFTTIWFDDVNRTGSFEPVGTAPEHQKRGLGKALMIEGLRRLERLGATRATVSSYSPGAHALYESAGFKECDRYEQWCKTM